MRQDNSSRTISAISVCVTTSQTRKAKTASTSAPGFTGPTLLADDQRQHADADLEQRVESAAEHEVGMDPRV